MERKQPRILDLFCCEGGAGMGYHRAGFEVVGVDIAPQPRYPFAFHQADAIAYLAGLIESGEIRQFDAIHASPPCQEYSTLKSRKTRQYPDLLAPMRQMLIASGLPWIMENVATAPMHQGVMICGTALGWNVRRHRLFDSSHLLYPPGLCRHHLDNVNIYGHACWTYRPDPSNVRADTGKARTYRVKLAEGRRAFDVPWMSQQGASECIPPAYTEWLGSQLLAVMAERAA